jgi:penicillin amidase
MLKIRRILKWTLLLTLVLLVVSVVGGFFFVKYQGIAYRQLETPTRAQVRFDAYGIPTVEAADWPTLIETQGFLHAGERLWQMDLMRRQAAGRLAEWFGADAVELDTSRRQEDWMGVAQRAASLLPPEEKQFCEAYAKGVNRFIKENRFGLGIEYALLNVEAEAWSCADSILVLMSMAEELTSVSRVELGRAQWRKHLTPEWDSFLFTDDHPWNVPYFGKPERRSPVLPPPEQYLPAEPPSEADQIAGLQVEQARPIGSNNWAWRGQSKYLLANDPHLGMSVPQLWYGIRLRTSAHDWVVGISIPGIPGVTLGMNSNVGWAFTNAVKDVEDFLAEKLDERRTQYLDIDDNGNEVWRPLTVRTSTIQIAGAQPKEVTALFTRRGPLVQRKALGEGYYSHQWLALNENALRLPLVAINRAKNWEEFTAAFDKFLIPAQHVLYMDRAGNMGYLASGLDVERRVSGMWPETAKDGEWKGLKPPAQRSKWFIPRNGSPDAPRALATANERNWIEEFSGYWAADDRKDRLRTLLATDRELSHEDMEKFQLDTHSRYLLELAAWLVKHARPANPEQEAMVARWRSWDGFAVSQPQVFTELNYAESTLSKLLLGRVKKHFDGRNDAPMEKYVWDLKRAWVLKLLEADGNFAAFGLSETGAAAYLLEQIGKARAAGQLPLYTESNRWQAQHPFASEIPLLGRLFKVEEYPQIGYNDLIRMEMPGYGASARLVWDLSHPSESTWVFPVGQSGHIGSPHYDDMHDLWKKGTARPKVFDENFDWGLAAK